MERWGFSSVKRYFLKRKNRGMKEGGGGWKNRGSENNVLRTCQRAHGNLLASWSANCRKSGTFCYFLICSFLKPKSDRHRNWSKWWACIFERTKCKQILRSDTIFFRANFAVHCDRRHARAALFDTVWQEGSLNNFLLRTFNETSFIRGVQIKNAHHPDRVLGREVCNVLHWIEGFQRKLQSFCKTNFKLAASSNGFLNEASR